jgi:hypothetical protein
VHREGPDNAASILVILGKKNYSLHSLQRLRHMACSLQPCLGNIVDWFHSCALIHSVLGPETSVTAVS